MFITTTYLILLLSLDIIYKLSTTGVMGGGMGWSPIIGGGGYGSTDSVATIIRGEPGGNSVPDCAPSERFLTTSAASYTHGRPPKAPPSPKRSRSHVATPSPEPGALLG